MDLILSTGVLLLLSASVYLVDIVRRKGKQFEFAAALFVGELGLVFVANRLIGDKDTSLIAILALGASMVVTAVVWARLFKQFQETGS